MVMEIHEDQPLVEPAAPWIRWLWLPAGLWWGNTNTGQYPCILSLGHIAYMIQKIPPDFTSLSSLRVAMYSTVNQVPPLSIWVHFGSVGEDPFLHSQTIVHNPILVANRHYELDLITTFPALLALLVPGDYLGIRLQNQAVANSVYVYGAEAVYA